ncbi:MAG: imidazoleglycerol-phosphate dehydratase HisB [bacterium]
MRAVTLHRQTKETDVYLSINLDGNGQYDIDTGVGFLDHMLELFAFHSRFDLSVKCDGDLHVDSHHTIEDIGITLGLAITEALSDKKGITRYGHFTIPMDEALVTTHLDISGRPYLVFNAVLPAERLGNYDTEMTEEFMRALAVNALLTLHVNVHYGKNTHHIIEGMFKSLGRALKEAVSYDAERQGEVVSSKGVL